MNSTNGANQKTSSTAAKLAQASQAYAFRANQGTNPAYGGLGAAAMRMAKTLGVPDKSSRTETKVSGPTLKFSSEAARENLNTKQRQLGDVLLGALKTMESMGK